MLAAADFGWISSNSDEGHKLRGCCFLPSLVQVGPINRARGSCGPSFCAKFHPRMNNIGRDRRKVKRAVPITLRVMVVSVDIFYHACRRWYGGQRWPVGYQERSVERFVDTYLYYSYIR